MEAGLARTDMQMAKADMEQRERLVYKERS
jgi:hypothetical protein